MSDRLRAYVPPPEEETWAAFFVGFARWPMGWHTRSWDSDGWDGDDKGSEIWYNMGHGQKVPVTKDAVKSPVVLVEHQTGGVHCGRVYLFGVLVSLPEDSALWNLVRGYYESDLDTPTFEQLLAYQEDLKQHGLYLKGLEYKFMTEGFLPFDFEAGVAYARQHGLLQHSSLPESLWEPAALEKWLRGQYERACRWRPGRQADTWEGAPAWFVPVMAAVVHSNSD